MLDKKYRKMWKLLEKGMDIAIDWKIREI